MKSPIRVAYLVTHPIQYQAPLLKRISEDPDIDLTVFFCSDLSISGYKDEGFGRNVKWDIPLLEGYKYEFLPAIGSKNKLSFFRPFNYGLIPRLRRGGFDVLWSHGYSRAFNLYAIILANILGIKVFVRDDASCISKRRGIIKIFIKKVFFAILQRFCSGFLTIGSLNADYYRKYSVPDEKLFLMPYAVDNLFFQQQQDTQLLKQLKTDLELDPKRPIILFASKFIARKCPLDLLNAYFALSADGNNEPWPYLLFVGDGEQLPEVEKLSQSKNWCSIKFLGFKNQSELSPLFAICDVFVLPSIYEPWGLVINEVMNAAKAVIVTDQVGCAPDLIKDGKNGYIVPAHDIDALANALSITTTDRLQSVRMGQKSLEIISKWSFEENVNGLKIAIGHALGRS